MLHGVSIPNLDGTLTCWMYYSRSRLGFVMKNPGETIRESGCLWTIFIRVLQLFTNTGHWLCVNTPVVNKMVYREDSRISLTQ